MNDPIPQCAPRARPGTGPVAIGAPVSRIDGVAKVTGTARYAAEHAAFDLAHGVVVNSTIARGRIVSIDCSAALAVPGVIDVLTHERHPRVRSLDLFYKDMAAPAGSPFKPLHDARIWYSGQPIALVVAETFEAARYAATLVRAHYEAGPHQTSLLEHLDRAGKPKRFKMGYSSPPKPRGDADAAFARAPCKVDAAFYSGVEHHNPMEMHATTVVRGGDGHLTIHDKTQGSQNVRWMVSRVFGLPGRKVTVRNEYVGGAFGSGLRPQYQLILAVMASLALERSVRVVLTRPQMFTFCHRPETWQRVRLAAREDGKLVSVIHEAVAETSRMEHYVEVVVNWSTQLYASENSRQDYKLVELDQPTPADMRAPGAAHGVHAIEVAMDELSYAVGMDPLALRLRNYAECDGATGLPFSSKALRACYEQGAQRFGWAGRPPRPRSMRDGHEWIGWGMATGTWDALQMFSRARAVFRADGRLEVASAATDIGTGTLTVMSQIAAASLGLPLEQVTFVLGDSDLPLATVEGGSAHVATVGTAVDGVCDKLRRMLWHMARRMQGSGFERARYEDLLFDQGTVSLRASPDVSLPLTGIMEAARRTQIEASFLQLPNLLEQKKYTRAAHSAVFCEVRVDEALGTVRVARVVSAVAAGRIINPKTARSQILGGMVWGIGQALHEETHSDHALGRFMNRNIAEYHIASHADIGDLDVIFVDEDDRVVSSLGAKGVGEIGLVGVAAAISNAIYHATGKRLRSTPMTPDKVMAR
ncbi:xanthine dehydrogenase family protein molybdopterin-binding subunit [Cupriavidus necator]|uniref:xanthine dehydrogenase family protein molybdopterin-binding subunit n=1 Tax=Cupriavidus necator TaxID=106590 RepID=UPI00148F5C86|nr:xanthine dehydrogenase family protein molybdopterin-binding subunit [Cupriavidus necator]NOV22189.1 xanthine dehydrogenase family protein molybdopterin-binding subunit [Cupriavidus necator]